MGALATSDTDNNTLYTINTLHDKRAPHATATLATILVMNGGQVQLPKFTTRGLPGFKKSSRRHFAVASYRLGFWDLPTSIFSLTSVTSWTESHSCTGRCIILLMRILIMANNAANVTKLYKCSSGETASSGSK